MDKRQELSVEEGSEYEERRDTDTEEEVLNLRLVAANKPPSCRMDDAKDPEGEAARALMTLSVRGGGSAAKPSREEGESGGRDKDIRYFRHDAQSASAESIGVLFE